MDDLGDRLKLAREQQGVSLKDIAARTKIAVTALEALERNDFSRLPGGIFGRAFVRAYAHEVGLDPEATVVDFRVNLERNERAEAERGKVRPEVTADDRLFLARQRRAIVILRISVAVAAIIGLLALVWQTRPLWKKNRQAETSSSVTAPDVAPAAASMDGSGVAAATVQAAPDTVAPTNRLVIELDVLGDCRVLAMADGKTVLSQILRVGDHPRFGADKDVAIEVSNAGALQWTINGHPAKPMGRSGAHVKVQLTPETAASYLP